MPFLAKLLNMVAPVFLNFFWGKLASWIAAMRRKQEDEAKSEAKNKAVREKTEAADTPEQREDAAKNVIKNV